MFFSVYGRPCMRLRNVLRKGLLGFQVADWLAWMAWYERSRALRQCWGSVSRTRLVEIEIQSSRVSKDVETWPASYGHNHLDIITLLVSVLVLFPFHNRHLKPCRGKQDR